MKVLATHNLRIPLVFKKWFTVVWSSSTRHACDFGGTVIVRGPTLCKQRVKLEEDHVVDFAMIVQLSRKEAALLGLRSAIGIIEGKKLA